ncbi:MAG: 2-(1,2-epoxy,2-dihydrophenyl)acetyl-CoA isomerase [Frankiales bacterium]|nr:2-(1,2-epoxy,2-dihydrophenyl)acetyl-CoA isomerase [Frankiales bacterium]
MCAGSHRPRGAATGRCQLSDTVLLARTGAVATITLNRPEALNACTVELKQALLHMLSSVRDDSAVRAVVLTGAGHGFCVGQDLHEHGQLLAAGAESTTVRDHYNPITLALATMPKPVVAAVNGVAAGAGAAFAFACDFRLIADTATIRPAFIGLGLGPDSGASWTLQRLVGYGRATALLLLGESISPDHALEMGLVNAVVPADHLAAAAAELAARLAEGPTLALAATKQALAAAAAGSLADALAVEERLQGELGRTSDHFNATNAFLAKQTPGFEGR